MKTYSVTEAKDNLAELLEQSEQEGAVRIRRSDGQMFVLKPDSRMESPLDVQGVDLQVSTDEIIDFIREGRRPLK